jgi:hypothetical protein
MSEKHPIRNGIIISVSSGIILVFLLWLWGVLSSVFVWIWSGILWLLAIFNKRIEAPVWSFVVIAVFIPIVFRIIRFFKREDTAEDYTQDNIYGAVWRWKIASGIIYDLRAFCPHCDMEMVYDEQEGDNFVLGRRYRPPQFTQLVCDNCNTRSERLDGNASDARDRVEREIHRRLRRRERGKNAPKD